MQVTAIPISEIHLRADARAVDSGKVDALAESIADVGLINPVQVRRRPDGWEVVSGAHRLQACQRLGLVDIEAVVSDADDLRAELAMIDENLCRAELTPVDRARQTARRKAIYEELHPSTKHGGDRKSDQVANTATRFSADTAGATRQSERAVQLNAERGEKVIEEVLRMIEGTALNTGAYLDKLKRLSPNDQVAAARRDLSDMRARERDKAATVRQNKINADVKSRAAREMAEILAEHVPGEWWDAVKSNLYASGAANIGHEFTNITGNSIMDRSAA